MPNPRSVGSRGAAQKRISNMERILPESLSNPVVLTSPLQSGIDRTNPSYGRIAPAETALQETERLLAEANGQQKPDLQAVELSVVMPCLDEADTVGACVRKAIATLQSMGIPFEVIVADNGSKDNSKNLAADAGARVIHVPERGYGAALMGGIRAAQGQFVVMGDADSSYDFASIPLFYEKLKAGMEIVQGCRLPRGGGQVLPGAMPFLHRWIGNPMLSGLVRMMFQTSVHDVYCGMRGFRRDWQASLDQRCTGMEFATEMIVKSTLFGGALDQVPITLYPDGRIHQRSHLRTFRDGWRTLRFFMLLSPRWTFLFPGAALAFFGTVLCLLALPQTTIAGVVLDVHTLLIGCLSILVASQLIWCAILAKTFAITEGILPQSPKLEWFAQTMTLERLLVLSGILASVGSAIIVVTTGQWAFAGFGPLNYATSMRWVIPAVGMIALSVQCAASSFLLSVLRMARL
jgi:Glycosyl transferase family 2